MRSSRLPHALVHPGFPHRMPQRGPRGRADDAGRRGTPPEPGADPKPVMPRSLIAVATLQPAATERWARTAVTWLSVEVSSCAAIAETNMMLRGRLGVWTVPRSLRQLTAEHGKRVGGCGGWGAVRACGGVVGGVVGVGAVVVGVVWGVGGGGWRGVVGGAVGGGWWWSGWRGVWVVGGGGGGGRCGGGGWCGGGVVRGSAPPMSIPNLFV